MIEADLEAEKKNAANEKLLRELAQSYKRFAKTDDGKIIMDDLAAVCGTKGTSARPSFETNRTFFNEGMRNVYIYIMQNINREDLKEKDNG